MPKERSSLWFNAEELNTMKGMSWLARKVAYDVLSGWHSGKYLGQGTDFSQYRSYMPGDDLRRVDWKLYGRTDKLYLKESELESRTKWYGILDASGSMGYEEGNVSKWKFAKLLWSAVAFIAKQQGDLEGLILINDKEMTHLPPNSGGDQSRMQALFQAEVKGNWPSNLILPIQPGVANKFIVITDLYEHSEELGAFIKSLLPLKNEVTVFHIMGQQEIDLDFAGITVFKDAETGRTIETDSARIRKDYSEKMKNFLKQSRNRILGWGADYHLFNVTLSPVSTLKEFLKGKRRIGNVSNR